MTHVVLVTRLYSTGPHCQRLDAAMSYSTGLNGRDPSSKATSRRRYRLARRAKRHAIEDTEPQKPTRRRRVRTSNHMKTDALRAADDHEKAARVAPTDRWRQARRRLRPVTLLGSKKDGVETTTRARARTPSTPEKRYNSALETFQNAYVGAQDGDENENAVPDGPPPRHGWKKLAAAARAPPRTQAGPEK